MFAKFFEPPNLEKSFRESLLFCTDKIISYDYKKCWSKVGNFSIALPFDKELLKSICLNGIIYIDKDWLWVQNISYDGKQVLLEGKDCKGFLETRISLYDKAQTAGADGYDIVKGTTADCIKHYINNNCINPDDENRKLPLNWIGGAEGLKNDSYMARFEYLSEIINKLCDGADIGYDIKGKLSSNGFDMCTLKGVDRSFAQSENSRVIFSAHWGNIVTQNFEHGIENLYNAVYGTDTEGYTKPVYRDNQVNKGINRRECNVSVSTTVTDEFFNDYALKDLNDNIENHSYDITVFSANYGIDYNIGDIISVRDDLTNNVFNAKITEVQKTYSQGKKSISIVLGNQKMKPIPKIINNLIFGTASTRRR